MKCRTLRTTAPPVSEYPMESLVSAAGGRGGRTDRREDALRRSAANFQAPPPPPGVTTVNQNRVVPCQSPLGLWGHESPFNRSALHSELPLLTPPLSGSLCCDSGPSAGRDGRLTQQRSLDHLTVTAAHRPRIPQNPTYRTYSFLFSSVTGTFLPLGFSSC